MTSIVSVERPSDGWEMHRLQDVLKEPATYGIVKAGTFQRVGVPMLRGGDIEDGKIATELPSVTQAKSDEFKRTVLQDRDVVIALVGYPGEAAVVPEWLIGANISRAVALLRPAAMLEPEFLTYYLNSADGRREFLKPGAGSAQLVVNLKDLNKLCTPLPPLPEQRAIAAVLGNVDALIASLDALIAKKRDIKQAAMQQLLTGKTRLPGFDTKAPLIETEIGLAPRDWRVITLRQACIKIQDGTHFSPKPGGSEFLYITSKNIASGALDLAQTEQISATEHAKIFSRCDVKKGDLLLTKDGASTGNAALNIIDEPFSLLSSVAFLRFDPLAHNASFFLYQILSDPGQQRIKREMSGNAITRLTLQKINALRVLAPLLNEQSAIAAVLTDMDAERAALEVKRDKTRALKTGMMQELLTGRIRLV